MSGDFGSVVWTVLAIAHGLELLLGVVVAVVVVLARLLVVVDWALGSPSPGRKSLKSSTGEEWRRFRAALEAIRRPEFEARTGKPWTPENVQADLKARGEWRPDK